MSSRRISDAPWRSVRICSHSNRRRHRPCVILPPACSRQRRPEMPGPRNQPRATMAPHGEGESLRLTSNVLFNVEIASPGIGPTRRVAETLLISLKCVDSINCWSRRRSPRIARPGASELELFLGDPDRVFAVLAEPREQSRESRVESAAHPRAVLGASCLRAARPSQIASSARSGRGLDALVPTRAGRGPHLATAGEPSPRKLGLPLVEVPFPRSPVDCPS